MTLLKNKRILLVVSGGIAAYKTPTLVRHWVGLGAEVRVVMTPNAREFVAPMSLQVVSENRVGVATFEPGFEYEIGHIELARWPDVIVAAPATASLIARLRSGIADDLATTIALASAAPFVVCPAMNTQMLMHVATQENIAALAARENVHVVAPDSGVLACKEVGAGRLPDPPAITRYVRRALYGKLLAGRRALVTAGPTREFFDPVRFVSNPSTGRMGYALAEALDAFGADVTLISGPVSIPVPEGVGVVDVVSAADMYEATMRLAAGERVDFGIMTAAVADYRPTERLNQKRKKGGDEWQPAFERTQDILAQLARSQNRPGVLIGFAAETENVVANAESKLNRKRIDGIVANSVAGVAGAFGNDRNKVTLIASDGSQRELQDAPKSDIAVEIVRWMGSVLQARLRRANQETT